MKNLTRRTVLTASVLTGGLGIIPAQAGSEDDIRSLFERFVAAQNAHDAATVEGTALLNHCAAKCPAVFECEGIAATLGSKHNGHPTTSAGCFHFLQCPLALQIVCHRQRCEWEMHQHRRPVTHGLSRVPETVWRGSLQTAASKPAKRGRINSAGRKQLFSKLVSGNRLGTKVRPDARRHFATDLQGRGEAAPAVSAVSEFQCWRKRAREARADCCSCGELRSNR
jgi:hypothetical protein